MSEVADHSVHTGLAIMPLAAMDCSSFDLDHILGLDLTQPSLYLEYER